MADAAEKCRLAGVDDGEQSCRPLPISGAVAGRLVGDPRSARKNAIWWGRGARPISPLRPMGFGPRMTDLSLPPRTAKSHGQVEES